MFRIRNGMKVTSRFSKRWKISATIFNNLKGVIITMVTISTQSEYESLPRNLHIFLAYISTFLAYQRSTNLSKRCNAFRVHRSSQTLANAYQRVSPTSRDTFKVSGCRMDLHISLSKLLKNSRQRGSNGHH